MMSYRYIETVSLDRIQYITLNRPDKRNALNGEMVEELKDALKGAADDNAVRIIILSANGKVFSAGADLAYLEQLQHNSYEENLADSHRLMELYWQIYTHEKLIISQVEGPAIAGGCGLAAVCDLCYAVPEASFGYTEVHIGFIPALVSVFLARKIGEGRTRELLLTAALIDATEAARIGLINAVADKEIIQDVVKEKAAALCTNTSPQSVAQTKQLLSAIPGMGLKEALEYAAVMNARARDTEDCRKGIKNFLDKGKLIW
jgi:methylglutaconyl-CoA hydratase